MMIQTALVIILFLAACTYIGRVIYLAFFKKDGKCTACPASNASKASKPKTTQIPQNL